MGYSATPTMPHHDVAMQMVHIERVRQVVLWGHDDGRVEAAHGNDDRRLRILLEEVGEVAKELNEGRDPKHLAEELAQVAAVAVAWIEGLSAEGLT